MALGVQVRILEVVPLCTFKITNSLEDLPIDKYLKLGGPTLSNSLVLDNVLFSHNLLSITGEVTSQPIVKDNYLYMLLGEVYNYNKSYPSDIYSVIEKYELYGDKFTNYLDGEFSIVVYDLNKKIINFYTDPWSTRMIWYESSVDFFYFGTFPLSAKSHRLLHNSHYAFYLNLKILFHINDELHSWNLEQYKDSYDDWESAFLKSVEKRYHKNTVLALSGGIDSSCIAAALTDLKLNFDSVVLNINKSEDPKSLLSILKYSKKYNKFKILKDKDVIDYYKTTSINFDSLEYYNQLKEYGLVSICMYMNSLCKEVLVTGQGADEIIDNYIHKYKTLGKPSVKMLSWPDNLKSFFPYDHFYDNRQRKLIDDHEFCCLSYGIETRNPFLDKKLAQEWLSLDVKLKNYETKSPLKTFLRKRGISISKTTLGFGDQNIFLK